MRQSRAAAAISPEAPAAFAMMASNFAPKPKPAKLKKASAPIRSEGSVAGKSKAVVQLGAYSSEERVSVAWAQLSKKYPAAPQLLSDDCAFRRSSRNRVAPVGPRVSTISMKRSPTAATLRGKGGNCLVRSTAGDSPAQFASALIRRP